MDMDWADAGNHSWPYLKDRYGRIDALRENYPKLLAKTPALQLAVTQIAVAEAAIDHIMESLPNDADDYADD